MIAPFLMLRFFTGRRAATLGRMVLFDSRRAGPRGSSRNLQDARRIEPCAKPARRENARCTIRRLVGRCRVRRSARRTGGRTGRRTLPLGPVLRLLRLPFPLGVLRTRIENDPNYGKRYTGGDKSLHTGSIRTSLSPQQTVRMPEAYYYDLHGRLVQSNGRNHLGGKDRYLARYDFTGRPVQTRKSRSSSASSSQRGLTTTLAYDHDGRLSQRRTTLSSVTTPLTARYSYDEAGRLSEKHSARLSVSYAYNVRGWIGKIASAPFVSELRYENPRYGGAPLLGHGLAVDMEARTATRKRLCVLLRRCRTDGRSQALRGRSENRRLHGARNPRPREREPGPAISRTAGGAVSDSLRFTLGGDVLLDVSGTSTGVFEYDPSGNLVKDGLNRLEFSYNCLNLMQTAETASGALKAQFTYGSDGRKLSARAGTGGFEYLGFFDICLSRRYSLPRASGDRRGDDSVGGSELLYPGSFGQRPCRRGPPGQDRRAERLLSFRGTA